MTEKEAAALLQKYTEGKCSPEEKLLFESIYNKIADQQSGSIGENEFENAGNEIYSNIIDANPVKKTILWPKIAIAASLLLCTSLGLYFYFNHTRPIAAIAQNDIAPGKDGATLTLANGKKILIADAAAGHIASQSGIQISKSAGGILIYTVIRRSAQESNATGPSIVEYNTLETSRKEQLQVQLPDGTTVWLDAASALKYPASFSAKHERIVELSGEGYFEVAKDKKHPFIVKTDKQEVQVLGTHFNINSYTDEPATRTTLVEGSVKVRDSKAEVVIKPGEESLSNGNGFKVRAADIEEVLAWKNGDFIFNEESVESVMRKLARWYDIEVIYQGTKPTDVFQGAISKNRNISQVLKVLEQTKVARFKVEGRRVIVTAY